MKRGFTIIELLVASMLLGMLVTILTMIFNQSSISWRLGVAGVSDMDTIRDNMAMLRDEADNAFLWNNKIYRSVGLWDNNGELLDRACNAPSSEAASDNADTYLENGSDIDASDLERSRMERNVGTKDSSVNSVNSYIVNVMSGGPANDVEDWQAIWSFPDDPSEW